MVPKRKQYNKPFLARRAVYELLACLVIVMVGGTRVLDYSSYEGADRLVRAALFLDVGHTNTTPLLAATGSPKEPDTSELAKQLMPLEYKVQETLALHKEYTLFSTPVQRIVTWHVEVPKPPPRPAKTTG